MKTVLNYLIRCVSHPGRIPSPANSPIRAVLLHLARTDVFRAKNKQQKNTQKDAFGGWGGGLANEVHGLSGSM